MVSILIKLDLSDFSGLIYIPKKKASRSFGVPRPDAPLHKHKLSHFKPLLNKQDPRSTMESSSRSKDFFMQVKNVM